MVRKILFILGKDVHNKAAYKIYEECSKRGFYIRVYASTLKDGHINIFLNNNIEVISMENLNEDIINDFDYIYAAIPIYSNPLFRTIRKYIFIVPSTYLDEVYFVNDFAFTIRDITKPLIEGEVWPIEKFNYEKMMPAMATGGPQYDVLFDMTQVRSGVILFIDAGHFPFGTKKLLAEYVIKIAEYCPDYELRVKPRYLPDDIDTTHMNQENLYDYLDNWKDIPPNLKLIRKHTDLKDELKECEIFICSEGTTSYIEAVLANKKMLLFEGFPSVESVLINSRHTKLWNKITSDLACRIPYQEIFKYLPQGIQMYAEDLNKLIFKLQKVTEDVVNAMEYIYETFIRKNRFPKSDYYTSDNYIHNMEADSSADWNTIIQRRYRMSLYDKASLPIKRLGLKLDYSPAFDFIQETKKIELNEKNIEDVANGLQEKLYDIYMANSEKLMESFYGQSLLCSALFKRGMLDRITKEKIEHHEYYQYCKAKLEIELENYTCAIELLDQYFEKVNHNLYESSLADEDGVKASAHYFKGVALYMLHQMDEARNHFKMCQSYWKGSHKKAKEYLDKIDEWKRV